MPTTKTDDERRRMNAEMQGRYRARKRKQGFCTWGGCWRKAPAGHRECAEHSTRKGRGTEGKP